MKTQTSLLRIGFLRIATVTPNGRRVQTEYTGWSEPPVKWVFAIPAALRRD